MIERDGKIHANVLEEMQNLGGVVQAGAWELVSPGTFPNIHILASNFFYVSKIEAMDNQIIKLRRFGYQNPQLMPLLSRVVGMIMERRDSTLTLLASTLPETDSILATLYANPEELNMLRTAVDTGTPSLLNNSPLFRSFSPTEQTLWMLRAIERQIIAVKDYSQDKKVPPMGISQSRDEGELGRLKQLRDKIAVQLQG